MIEPFKLAYHIKESEDFRIVLWSNYLKYSNGSSMREYAKKEKTLLRLGNYGVEEFYPMVNEYFKFLDQLIGE